MADHVDPETTGQDASGSFEPIPEDQAEDDPDDQDEQGEGDDQDPDDDNDDTELQDLAQVLTVTARRLASTRLGRKYSGSKVPAAELKKRTSCAACGETGHWKGDAECKLSGNKGSSSSKAPSAKGSPGKPSAAAPSGKAGDRSGKGQPHQAFTVTHSDLGSYELYTEEYGQSFADPKYSVSVVFSAQLLHEVGSQFVGYMVLDTACQRTCCGRSWAAKHFDLLKGFDLQPVKAPIHDQFQFGKGAPVEADCRAYVPVSFNDHIPLLIGTGVLDAEVPLLASNVLLKALGMILDLPSMSVTFQALGCSAPVHMINGHLSVRIDCFGQHAHHDFAQLLSCTSWHDAPPEAIFGQTGRATSKELRHACDSPGMASGLAPTCEVLAQLHDPLVCDHGPRSEVAHLGPSMDVGCHPSEAGPAVSSAAGHVRAQRHAAVRQRDRKVQQVQAVREEMGVGQSARKMGSQTIRRIFTLIGTAIALFGQYTGDSAPGATTLDFIAGGPGQDEYGTTQAEHSSTINGIRADFEDSAFPGPGHRPLGASSRTIPQRSDGGDQLGGARLGQRRRLAGDLERAAKVYEKEVAIYDALPTTCSRPPPNVDILEIFAGEAKTSGRAHRFGLNACQPIDLQFGWDLRQEDQQKIITNLVQRLRPWAIILDYPSSLYNVHNENLNYHNKPGELHQLRAADRDMLNFAVALCRNQHDAGRLFFISNPRQSRLWGQPVMASLLSLPGVTTTTAHMGAFGAENQHSEPVRKAIQVASNYPALDNDLGRRLSATDLLYCTPLQGRDALRAQIFPDAFVDQLLASIKRWISQREPQRFGYYMVLALARPTTDTAAWNHVFEEIEKSFTGTSRRPYIVDPDSTFGKEIQDLFRMDAVRIQVANTPSQRRFYSDLPHVARGAALQYIDKTRSVEVEQLDEVRQPKGRFSKPVQFAVFIYGTSRQASGEQQPPQDDPGPSVPISGLPTDVTFPGLTDKVPIEIRRSVARLHVNLGHPSPQELNRLLCHQGVPSSGVQECVRKLQCATCQRLSTPQQPRPSAVPSLQAGQFGDLVQGDFFWVRLSSGTNVQVLGLADTATGYHQAAILREKSSRDAYDLLHTIWLRPYGLPVRLLLDPDPLFQGDFQELLSTINVQVEYCPAEAHWVIGTVERRNCVLRTILEKMINDHVVDDLDRLDHVLSAAVHALNSFVTVKGRSPYQAVYGKIHRIPGGLFTDDGSLAQSVMDPGLAAERARSEAIGHLAAMNVDQGLRRAILRKTNNTKIEGLQPGQKIAYWRWRRRGLRKRGAWTTGRFLAYDPSQPNKQCWIRSGNNTILVTMEQLRLATGWEDWCPDESDIKCLKDATLDIRESVLQDQQGPAPPQDELPDKDEDILDLESIPPTPSVAPGPSVPVLVEPREQNLPQQPQAPQLPPLQATRTDNYNLTLSPTFQQNTYVQSFGDPSRAVNAAPRTPRTPRLTRSRSPAARPQLQGRPQSSALPAGASYDDALQSAAFDSAAYEEEPPEQREGDQQQLPPTSAQPGDQQQEAAPSELPGEQQQRVATSTTPSATGAAQGDQQQSQPTSAQPGHVASSASSTSKSPTEEVPSSQAASQPSPEPSGTPSVLPQKRPFDTLTTLLATLTNSTASYLVRPSTAACTGLGGAPSTTRTWLQITAQVTFLRTRTPGRATQATPTSTTPTSQVDGGSHEEN